MGGLRDIMVSTQGLYDQTLTYGIGLISISTAETPGSEPSVQQITATQYNAKTYAHQNRLGGSSYYTDPGGELTAYFEFDAWGVSYTPRPEDANYAGLDIANGFTGYTYDAVIEVYFAQARLYDANDKRFLQVDIVAGSVFDPQTLNPYSYCNNDPVNLIDPTGKWDESKGDSHRSPEDQAAIRAATDAYYAATTQAGRDAAHATAEYIRNNPSKPAPAAPTKPSATSAGGDAAPAGYAPYPYTQPPTAFSVLVEAIHHTTPALSQADVYKTASQWLAAVYAKAPGLPFPSNPAPQSPLPSVVNVPNVWTDIVPDVFRDVKDNLSAAIPSIFGARVVIADERLKYEIKENLEIITFTTGRKETTNINAYETQSAPLSVNATAKLRTGDAVRSSVGASINIMSLSASITAGMDNIGFGLSVKSGENATSSSSVRVNLSDLEIGFEISETIKINDHVSDTAYTNLSISAKGIILAGITAGSYILSHLYGTPALP